MIKNVSVLVVAPNDVIEEKNVIYADINRTEKELSFNNEIRITVQNLEYLGENIINKASMEALSSAFSDLDIYIGIFWKRIGKYSLDEFTFIYDQWKRTGRPRLLLFFKRVPFYPESIDETEQISSLVSFKNSLSNLDLLYSDFESSQELSSKLNIAFQRTLKDIVGSVAQERNSVSNKDKTIHYDVALSFSGNDREYAAKLASKLKSLGLRVFYDAWDTSALWGHNLYEHLQGIYSSATCCIILISSSYKNKSWTNFEMKAAVARSFVDKTYNVLPILLDNTELPPQLATIGYMDAGSISMDAIATAILKRISILNKEIRSKDDSIKEVVHVITRGNGWVVKKANQDAPMDTFRNKETAISYAKKLQHEDNKVEIVIHKQDGTIEEMIDG
jgi:hypothetical protein